MNLTNLILLSAGITTALAGTYKIDSIQRGILTAQAKLIYESRVETWGSPIFLTPKRKSQNQVHKNAHGKK